MKQLKIATSVVAFLAIIVWAASAGAQGLPASNEAPRVTVDVDLAGGNLNNTFTWPFDPNNIRTEETNTWGVDLDATVRVTNTLRIGFRLKRDALGEKTNLERHESHNWNGDEKVVENRFTNPGKDTGSRDYYEAYSELSIPGSRGHSFVAGFAWDEIEEHNRYTDSFGGITESGHRNFYRGVILGGKGAQDFRSLTVNYGARIDFPWIGIHNTNGDVQSHLFEVSETVIWNINQHVGIGGGHEFGTHFVNADRFSQNQGGNRFSLKIRLSK